MEVNLHLQGRLDVVLNTADEKGLLNHTLNSSGVSLPRVNSGASVDKMSSSSSKMSDAHNASSASLFSKNSELDRSHGATLVREVLKNQVPKETVNVYGLNAKNPSGSPVESSASTANTQNPNSRGGGSSSSSSSSSESASYKHSKRSHGNPSRQNSGHYSEENINTSRRTPRGSNSTVTMPNDDGIDISVLKKSDQDKAAKKKEKASGRGAGDGGVTYDTPRKRNGTILIIDFVIVLRNSTVLVFLLLRFQISV